MIVPVVTWKVKTLCLDLRVKCCSKAFAVLELISRGKKLF